jgi:hypothetical protein
MKSTKDHNIEHDPEEAALVIDAFYHACRRGEGGLKSVPGLLLRIINEGLWKKRKIKQTKEIVEFDKFEDFVTGMPPEGLGENPETLKNLCRDNEEAMRALQQELGKELGSPGGVNNPEGLGGKSGKVKDCQPYNVSLSKESKHGNKSDYLLARIKRDAPEIAEDYFNGKFPSVRQAAIAAGIVKVPTALERVLRLLPKLSKEEIKEVQSRLSEMI